MKILTWKTERACQSAHHRAHEIIQLAILRLFHGERSRANIIQCLVVETDDFIRILDELVDAQSGIVRFYNNITRARRRKHRISRDHSIGVLFTYPR